MQWKKSGMQVLPGPTNKLGKSDVLLSVHENQCIRQTNQPINKKKQLDFETNMNYLEHVQNKNGLQMFTDRF